MLAFEVAHGVSCSNVTSAIRSGARFRTAQPDVQRQRKA